MRGVRRVCVCVRACVRAIHTCALPHVQLKQLKELEQEKEVLLQGLEMMARGRDWYQQQLQRVQERQRRLGRSRASTVSNAARDRAVPVPRQGDPPPPAPAGTTHLTPGTPR